MVDAQLRALFRLRYEVNAVQREEVDEAIHKRIVEIAGRIRDDRVTRQPDCPCRSTSHHVCCPQHPANLLPSVKW